MYCGDCNRPQQRAGLCPDCTVERRRLRALHLRFDQASRCEADRTGLEDRITQYQNRATAGKPLFGLE